MSSADGQGRTLLEILTGKNKRDMTPLELQYHNPLEAKIGCTISFGHDPDMAGINFVIEKISVYETKVGRNKFYHTDYHLKGISLDVENYIRMRLRVTPDDNVANELGCKVQLLYLYDESSWDEGLFECVNDPSGEFHVNYDDEGNELADDCVRKYWRPEVGGLPVTDPYHAQETVLEDKDGDATVDEDELEHFQVTYWDFSRGTQDENAQAYIEALHIEMDDEERYFTFLRGQEIPSSEVFVF